MFVTAWLVKVSSHNDGAVVGGRLTIDEALWVECLGSATAVCDEFGDVAGISADEPG